MMEMMQKVAARHGLVCLLHEKPFAGVNGSGKHNNWSISTDTGVNLLSPGETPYENAQFLLFLCAVIKAVDDYQDLLRISVATAGNDHRLGANEAPPAIISVFLGDELSAILDAIENDKPYSAAEKKVLKLGVDIIPGFTRDNTDRNRTSPFAFTGNKFEFRSLGSSNSIACANMMLNSAVAESLKIYADRLEKEENFEDALHEMIKKTIHDHKRILFNGNGYDESWVKEATEVRGLLNYVSTPDCMPHLLDEKNVTMLTSHKVFTKEELESRCEIMLDNYCKQVKIEANTELLMAHRMILPAIEKYAASLSSEVGNKKSVSADIKCAYEVSVISKISGLADSIYEYTEKLEEAIDKLDECADTISESKSIRDNVIPVMEKLRSFADEAEIHVSSEYWPLPSYGEMLFSVR
jgi:glutamine synthetase